MAPEKAVALNWNNAAQDYGTYRPGYPEDYFSLLQLFGIGHQGQQILDIGSGTGALAIPFARQGAQVTAVDLSPGQIAEAREKAAAQALDIRFIVSGAEEAPVESDRFHAVTASMCWGYFHPQRIVEQVKRVLLPDGLLLISSIVWQENDEVTRRSNALLAKYNKRFSRRYDERDTAAEPEWSHAGFRLKTYHQYPTQLPFTRFSWRGRMRATKFIGAALPREQVDAFDRELAEALESVAPERFEVAHTIRIQIFQRTLDPTPKT